MLKNYDRNLVPTMKGVDVDIELLIQRVIVCLFVFSLFALFLKILLIDISIKAHCDDILSMRINNVSISCMCVCVSATFK